MSGERRVYIIVYTKLKGKPKQMRNAVTSDMKSYVEKHGRLILLSMIAATLCFGFLAFSRNIRIDTEELINEPGSTLGWLTIGRFSLVFLKRLLGLNTHSALKSGLLFLLFFVLGANLLTFSFYHFSRRNEKYPYWVFVLLYCTSNIWNFQVYFSLQQAEVALAMLLVLVAAFLAVKACFCARGLKKLVELFASAGLLIVGLGAYQALAAYYIAVCIALFIMWLENVPDEEMQWERKQSPKLSAGQWSHKQMDSSLTRKMLAGIAELLVQFGVSYLVYSFIAGRWFMTTEGYMQNQKGWGRMSVMDCIHAILLTGKNVVLGYGPRNFSFFTIGVLTTLFVVCSMWKKKCYRTKGQFALYLTAMAGLVLSPFLMTTYMGEMLVTRSQFALPVVAAFLGMYGMGHLRNGYCGSHLQDMRGAGLSKKVRGEECVREDGEIDGAMLADGKHTAAAKWGMIFLTILVLFTAAVQTGYNLRLAYTDDVRYTQDVELTETVVAALTEANGGELPAVPVLFVGYHVPEYDSWCARTEMYGWSFYEWDYSVENPTGATHRINGFMQAYSGYKPNEAISDEMREKAATMAGDMPDFPAEGAVRVTDEFVVVKLSDIRERTDINWW